MRVVLFALIAVGACTKKDQGDGLPPATQWQADPAAGASQAHGGGADPSQPPVANPNNPHAGMAMGGDPANPHAGIDMGGADPTNPHAGMDMSNPHGGGGTDVTKLGLPPPDPDRKLDPNHHVRGRIAINAKAKDHVKAGTAVFVIVKRAGPDGKASGPPLAVDKLTWSDGGIPFELTDAQAMVGGTELAGDVIVMARYDQDSDALSKQPGDVTGELKVKIPADNVKLELDTVLP